MATDWKRSRVHVINLIAIVGACLFYWDATDTGLLPGAISVIGLFACFFLLAGSLAFFAWSQRGTTGRKD